MNKLLLIWNVIITVILFGAILSGCASIDPQFTALQSQVKSNRTAIETLTAALNQDRQQLASQAQQIAVIEASTNAQIQQLTASIQQYVQQYVASQAK